MALDTAFEGVRYHASPNKSWSRPCDGNQHLRQRRDSVRRLTLLGGWKSSLRPPCDFIETGYGSSVSDDAVVPPTTTSDAGIGVPSDEFSLSAGAEGPLLLQDHYLLQKMAHFNRERVPEHVVHAKGHGAFGFFEATEDVISWL